MKASAGSAAGASCAAREAAATISAARASAASISASVGAELEQPPAADDQRVAGHPLLDLRGRAVLRRVGAAVPEVPVGQRLDHGRPAAGPGPVDRLGHRVVHRDHVVAVDEHAGHAVGRGAVGGRVGDGGDRRDRGVLHVAVVLAHEEHRQLPDRGQVERLVEGADVGGAVAEERDRDLRRTPQLRGPGGAVGHRQVGADDGVRAEHPVVGLGEVHRAALGLADPGGPLHQLGQTALRRGAAGDGVVVAAVGGEDVVVRSQRCARAHRDRLVAGGQVGRALDQAAHEEVVRGLLGAADDRHLLVPAEQGRRGHPLDRLARHSPLPFAVFRCDWESRTVGSDPSTVQ